MVRKKSQYEIILSHLKKHGYITRLIANQYLIGDLRKRIQEMRDSGHAIDTVPMKDDTGRRYSKYVYRGIRVALCQPHIAA